MTTVNSLAYDSTSFGSATSIDGSDTDDSVELPSFDLQGPGIFPAGSGVDSTHIYAQAPPLDPCKHKNVVSGNFKKRTLLPCPEDQEDGKKVPSGNTPGVPGNPEPPGQEIKVPGSELENDNPWIQLDSFFYDPSRKRCDWWKKLYICDGSTYKAETGLVDGCLLYLAADIPIPSEPWLPSRYDNPLNYFCCLRLKTPKSFFDRFGSGLFDQLSAEITGAPLPTTGESCEPLFGYLLDVPQTSRPNVLIPGHEGWTQP